MQNNHASQESIERICVYVIKLLEFSNQGYEREALENMQHQMLKCISMSTSETCLFENLIQILRKMNNSINDSSIAEDEVMRIQNYVDEHYLNIESMEEVAEEFGYNYTYLSRMFKKKAGESMSRYITIKKIALAKDLLQNKLEMKLTEISDLCGYSDYRYFSRVFKNEVGISPSEYREEKKDHHTSHMSP